jgi:hypothetical protein
MVQRAGPALPGREECEIDAKTPLPAGVITFPFPLAHILGTVEEHAKGGSHVETRKRAGGWLHLKTEEEMTDGSVK